MLGVKDKTRYMNFTITTDKKKEVLLAILKNNTQETQSYFLPHMQFDNLKFFSGNVNDDFFKFSRTLIHHRNSFVPIIEGNIIDNGDNRSINVSMHYHPFVFSFIVFWLVFVVIGCIVISFQNLDNIPFAFRLIPYFMLVGGFLLFTIPYKVECNFAKKKLIELLQ